MQQDTATEMQAVYIQRSILKRDVFLTSVWSVDFTKAGSFLKDCRIKKRLAAVKTLGAGHPSSFTG